MKLINPKYNIIPQKSGIEGIYEAIELAGRVCYQSEPVEGITSKDFVERLIKNQHLSCLEHGTVYLKVPINVDVAGDFLDDVSIWTKCRLVKDSPNWWAITTNYRRIIELGYQDYLQYLCEPTEFHEKRIMVRFISMIQFYKDITRHRKFSYCIESTRYNSYNKGKYNGELTYIIPSWLALEEGSYERYEIDEMDGEVGDFLRGLKIAEELYLKFINFYKWKPQQAAKLLPQDTKAEIIMTGFVSDWKHVFSMRSSIIAATGQPDTEVSILFDPLYNEFKERKLI